MKLGILIINILFKGKLYYARFPLCVFKVAKYFIF